ncbi:putative membrane associated protein [Streptococcus pyogenes MGAS5005]|nr:putative membrane associated protein [Streptococcus pyogenes MGAS6180]AAZ51099.1 putative membrane associated protein [Streptococcus pyogenes MGAS5005]ABF33539.1 hypothetical protein MGAS10270_Spy0475 [Streptococcus pyogenes MGAS10270]EFM33044.1 hypothetical protein HMPREF0841_1352 [Streptococcus pyogenes ATCC 10782]EQL77822.1 hypothetical protein HMPREF1230_1757 [Streptococcus pyogenes GA19681]ESA53207.1 hypothetical protein HMPREF1236_1863 [Streptococcus pyogenes GA40056]BAR43982.1 hypot
MIIVIFHNIAIITQTMLMQKMIAKHCPNIKLRKESKKATFSK